MKSSLSILVAGLLLGTCSTPLYGQAFTVKCADDRSRYIVYEILRYLRVPLTSDSTEADYMVECRITHSGNFNAKHKGCIILYDKTGTEVSRTREIRRNPCAANGFNASADIFQVLAEEDLPPLIEKIFDQ